jgi:hypothetical protein
MNLVCWLQIRKLFSRGALVVAIFISRLAYRVCRNLSVLTNKLEPAGTGKELGN